MGFPRGLAVLMQLCWQHQNAFRPSIGEIIADLTTLLNGKLFLGGDVALVSLSKEGLERKGQIKEKLRTLPDMVDGYLMPDLNRWDKHVHPRLVAKLEKHNAEMVRRLELEKYVLTGN